MKSTLLLASFMITNAFHAPSRSINHMASNIRKRFIHSSSSLMKRNNNNNNNNNNIIDVEYYDPNDDPNDKKNNSSNTKPSRRSSDDHKNNNDDNDDSIIGKAFTGIKKFADSIPGGCGCDHRKEWFNKNFPYNMNKK